MGLANSFANGGLSLSNDFGWPGPALPPNNNFANIFGVQDLTELTAIVPPEDKSGAMVEDLRSWWFYDADSMATPNGTTVVLPDSGSLLLPGRWHSQASGGGGGSTVYVTDAGFAPIVMGRSHRNATDEWLRGPDGVPTNLSPLGLAFPMTISGMSAATRDLETCSFEVYKGTVARAGGVPNVGSAVAVLGLSASNGNYSSGLNYQVYAGEELAVFVRGTSVSFPTAVIWTLGQVNSVISASRNHPNAVNEWLRGPDGAPHNQSPMSFSHALRLRGISFCSRTPFTGQVEVHTGVVARVGGTPLAGTQLADLPCLATQSAYVDNVAIDLAAGSEIGVFLRGSGCAFPQVNLWFSRSP